MDNKHHVRIVGFKTIPYKNKKTGAPEEMKFAQCVVTSESAEKGQQVVVGELIMPKHLHDTGVGEYLADFELSVGQDLRIGSRLAKLHPIGQSAAATRAASVHAKDQEKKVA
jgi:hypothetical protein